MKTNIAVESQVEVFCWKELSLWERMCPETQGRTAAHTSSPKHVVKHECLSGAVGSKECIYPQTDGGEFPVEGLS